MNKARQIMAQFLGGNKVKFGPYREHKDRLVERRHKRFSRVPRKSAKRESLKRFRRRVWYHRSFASMNLRGRKGRRRKRAIIKEWWHEEQHRAAGRPTVHVHHVG